MNLEYDSIWPCHCSIRLNCGREIILEVLHQELTYRGLMLGSPTSETNDMTIKRFVTIAANLCHILDQSVVVIEPPRRSYLREPGDMDSHRRRGWVSEWLPMVACIGQFGTCEGKLESFVVIIWFQDEFAPPISDLSLEQIKSIDWDENTVVYEP